jgi:DNA-binding ferritin-like protein
MNDMTVQERRLAPLSTPSDLGANAIKDLSTSLTTLLADTFALYVKTKNFHWHMSGSHFRDYHLLLDEQSDQIFATTDAIAERVRKIGGTTLRSIGHIGHLQRLPDNDGVRLTLGNARRTARRQQAAHRLHARDTCAFATNTTTSRPPACSKSGSTTPNGALGSYSRRPDETGHDGNASDSRASPLRRSPETHAWSLFYLSLGNPKEAVTPTGCGR